MTTRFYSSTAQETTLQVGINNSATTIQVASTTGFPVSFPYTLALDYESATEELVDVTAGAGTSLTVTRAIDGTSAAAHGSGARVRHVSSARDFRDSRNHENATEGVHGLAPTDDVVGVDATQTLNNKTLTDPTINGATVTGTVAGTPTYSGQSTFTGGLRTRRAAATDNALEVQLNADTQPRLVADADGTLRWGPGNAVDDVTLSRAGVGLLSSNGQFSAVGVNSTANINWNVLAQGNRITLNGSSNVNPTLTVGAPLGQTGDAIRVEQGVATLAEINAVGEANFQTFSDNVNIAVAQAGWNISYQRVCVKGGFVTINMGFTRTGGTITASATGDITDTPVCTVQSAYLPNSLFSLNTLWFNYSTGIAGGTSELDPNTGVLTINTLNGGASILNGHTVRMTLNYTGADPS